MKLSIVTTMYYSAPYLEEFYSRVCAAAEKITDDYEVIFVNDGSPDESLDQVVSLHYRDFRVKVIDLSRNFGHHRAIMTGIAHAQGELVFLIDCDLEEEPELLGSFYEQFQASGADVVYGVQQVRKGGFFERLSGNIFYLACDILTNYPIPRNPITVRLMSQQYVANLVEHRDREIFLVGLWAITGFKQVPVTVHKHNKGKSTYNFTRKVTNFVNAITSFSNRPLAFIFYLGCIMIFTSGIAAAYLVFRKILFGALLSGWPSLVVSVWMLGGLTIFCQGVIGIYLAKVFTEIKQRPYTIIRNVYQHTRDISRELS